MLERYQKRDEKTKEVYTGKVVKQEVPYLVRLEEELRKQKEKEAAEMTAKLEIKAKKAHDALQRKVFGAKWSSVRQDLNFVDERKLAPDHN